MEGSRSTVDLDPMDEDLAHLTAQGLTVSAMANRLSLSARSVNRRLARLRQQFGVGSTAELAVSLARRGY
jgi:DNA-binding CsgD family transcriptional regulator